MTWTTTPPDQPGWWWVRRGQDDTEHMLIAEVPGHGLHTIIHDEGRSWISRPMKDVQQQLSVDDVEWAGPIPEPKEAK